jgi:broad specificity phosphatase PhoE
VAGITFAVLRLLIVRHGQTPWNLEGRNQGHADIELDEVGIAQAEDLVRAIVPEHPDAIYTSDMKRTRATAAGLAERLGISPIEDHRLRERDYGVWEGMTRDEILLVDAENHAAYHGDPVTRRSGGAESGVDVFMRVAYFLTDLLKERVEGTVAIITHGGTGSALIASLIHGSPATANCFRLSNCAITEILVEPTGRRRLVRFNDVSHLGAQPLQYRHVTG